MKFRKKLVVIEAIQWTGSNWAEMNEFVDSEPIESYPLIERIRNSKDLLVFIAVGSGLARPEDWVIKDEEGFFSVCNPDIFESTYDLVKEEES